MISAVIAHKIESSDINSSTLELHSLRVSPKQGLTILEFGSDATPLGCICGPSCVHKRQKTTSTRVSRRVMRRTGIQGVKASCPSWHHSYQNNTFFI